MDVCIIPGGTCMYCSVFITTNCVLMNNAYCLHELHEVHMSCTLRSSYTVVTAHVTVYQSRPCVTFDGAKSWYFGTNSLPANYGSDYVKKINLDCLESRCKRCEHCARIFCAYLRGMYNLSSRSWNLCWILPPTCTCVFDIYWFLIHM